MSKLRFQLLTVETDTADPEVFAAIRKLIRRASLGGATVVAAVPPAAAQPAEQKAERPTQQGASRHTEGARPSEPERSLASTSAPAPQRVEVAKQPSRRADEDIKQVVEAGNAAATAPLSLEDRILAAVQASPGVTAGNLTMALLGKADGDVRRRVDMLVGNLQMAGKIMRTNGQLFPKGYRGAVSAPAAKPPEPKPSSSDADAKALVYKRLIAAFTADNSYPIPKLAEECFGDSTGKSTRKVRLMLLQCRADERLEQLGVDRWRPWTGKSLPDLDDGEETESNGQPDDSEDAEELEV